jgi:hypothetical protein
VITVLITKSGGKHELARIEIENVLDDQTNETGTYSVRFAVDTGSGVAIYQRRIDSFFRRRYNVLALLRIALDTLMEQELSLDGDPDTQDARRTSDLARRLPRAGWPF